MVKERKASESSRSLSRWGMLQRHLQNSLTGTAPSRLRLGYRFTFNTLFPSRAGKRAVSGILQVPLQLVQAQQLYFTWNVYDPEPISTT
jgi:hypothetical protein